MKNKFLLFICFFFYSVIGPVVAGPVFPTELYLALLNADGSNINTSLLLTIDYTDGNMNSQSINSVDNPSKVIWRIMEGKSRLHAFFSAKDQTEIEITVDGYEPIYVTAVESGSVVGDYYLVSTGGGDTTPPIISNVNATAFNPYVATIVWDTDEGSNSLVKLGLTPGLYTTVKWGVDRDYVTSHRVEIEIQSNTTYYYVVNSTDPSGNSNQSDEYSFITPVSLEDRVSSLEAELAQKNIEIDNLNSTAQEQETKMRLIESTVNTLKDFVKNIYDALPVGWKTKIGPWPF